MSASVNTRPTLTEKKIFGVGDRLQVVRCRHCREVVLFEHQSLHAYDCRKKRNAEKLGAMNLSKDGKPLFAVAVSRKRRGKWLPPEVRYAHADSPGEAKRVSMADEKPGNYHIIDVGLAVGWYQQEKTGIIVSG
jgi:hypothetical protein